MTINDTYETAGMRTTCGLKAWDHVPERDAEAVRRPRGAGAVIFGTTNTPTLAGDWQTFNPIFGTTNNPWDTTRTTGGSSGGAAAAVATGMTALELGSDIAGSIRVPSNWCGTCGHKPRARMAEFLREVDALLMPVAVAPAIPHDHSEPLAGRTIESNGARRPYLDMFGWVALATVTYLPATVVPVGLTDARLPVGVQIVGPYLEDRTTLAVARCIAELLGGFEPPPGV